MLHACSFLLLLLLLEKACPSREVADLVGNVPVLYKYVSIASIDDRLRDRRDDG